MSNTVETDVAVETDVRVQDAGKEAYHRGAHRMAIGNQDVHIKEATLVRGCGRTGDACKAMGVRVSIQSKGLDAVWRVCAEAFDFRHYSAKSYARTFNRENRG